MNIHGNQPLKPHFCINKDHKLNLTGPLLASRYNEHNFSVQTVYFVTHRLALALLLLLAAPLQAQAQNADIVPTDGKLPGVLLILITALLILQTLLIIGLQRSRSHHKKAKADLKIAQRELEQRIVNRTNKLRTINNQLYEEIAKHEITEELLCETQDYLHSIINSMPSILIGVTRQGTVTHWNSAAEQCTSVPAREALGQNIDKVFLKLPIDLKAIEASIDGEAPTSKENIQLGNGNQANYFDLAIYPLLSSDIQGAVIRIDNVTQRVRLESMMIQNEKMMSLGEMAAGMAHEINNPLSAIINSVQNIERRVSEELIPNQQAASDLGISIEQLRAYLHQRDLFSFIESIREAGNRAAQIVTNMLEFSRGNTQRRTLVDVSELMNHSLELAHNTLELKPLGVRIVKEFASELPLINCAAQEIQQVTLNLLRNAKQSFEHKYFKSGAGPTITLRTRQLGETIVIEIEDNGTGMDLSVSRHIFEPFFTTKGVGEGTGLGLSVSYFIITEHHNGTIEVDSEPGAGTRFIIKLPIQAPDDLD